jgi:formylmethanofuran:tetrahydromethanopterin formyltransferase
MTYHIPSDPSAPAQASWALVYSHESGVDVTLYPSEEVAGRAAGRIIVQYYEDCNLSARYLERLMQAINSKDWDRAIEIFNRNNETESILVEKPFFMSDSEVEIPTMTLDEETEEESENNDE